MTTLAPDPSPEQLASDLIDLPGENQAEYLGRVLIVQARERRWYGKTEEEEDE